MSDNAASMISGKLERWAAGAIPAIGLVRIAGARRAEGGQSSETWLVDARLGETGELLPWVLRIEPRGRQIYQDPSVARQFRVIRALAGRAGLPVPEAIALEEDPGVLGAPFFLMARAGGTAPPGNYHAAGLLAEASPAQRVALWTEAMTLLARLHAEPAGDELTFLGWPGTPGGDGAAQELARWDEYRAWCGISELPLYDRARTWLDDHRPARVSAGFAWGDARPCNMLFAGGRCTALLDWETASLGGAESDLGWWLCYDRMITETEGLPRLPGIGNAAQTLALWEAASGRKVVDIEWHVLFATFRFVLISERARLLAIRAGQMPPDAWGHANPAVRLLATLLAEAGQAA